MRNYNKITIIIPTFNRQAYALRNAKYWSELGVNVIILDGSSSEFGDIKIPDAGKSGIKYLRRIDSFADRLLSAREFVSTEFVSLLADDEWFIPSALDECVDTLLSNRSAVSCVGRSLGKFLTPSLLMSRGSLLSFQSSIMNGVTGSTGGERIVEHLRNYSPISIYACARVDAWKAAVSIIGKIQNFKSYGAGTLELAFEVAMAHQGNLLVLNELMWIRSAENSPSYDLASENERGDDRDHFLSYLAELLKELSPKDQGVDYLKRNVLDAFDAYDRFSTENSLKSRMESLNTKHNSESFYIVENFVSKLLVSSHVRKIVFNFIKKFLSILPLRYKLRLPYYLQLYHYSEVIPIIKDSGTKVDEPALRQILGIVRRGVC